LTAPSGLPAGGDSTQQEWASGILLIQRKLKSQLERLGLQEIDAAGSEFDPNLHEAVNSRG
jgi:molecular chaperone GrpE (heat shock protein)